MDLDTGKCALTNDGNFTIKSAWHLVSANGYIKGSFSLIWDKRICPKILVFMWRLLHKGITIYEYIKNIHIPLPSKCRCCVVNAEEDRNHLFWSGDIAQALWKRFSNILGLKMISSNFNGNLMNWWIHSKAGRLRNILCRIIPAFICWHLWCARNKSFFEGVPMKESTILDRICGEIKMAFHIFPFTGSKTTFCLGILEDLFILGASISLA